VITPRAALARGVSGVVGGVRDHGVSAAKASAAAVLAWLLVGWLMPQSGGFYAPMVAVLSVLPTVLRTVRDAVQRLVAVGLGLGMGWVVAVTVGLHWWSLGAVLFVSFLFWAWHRLGEEGVQVPVGALFVLVFARDPTVYVAQLLAEGVLGAVVAAAVNVAVLPPVHVRGADRALGELRLALGDLVDDMSAAVGEDWPPRVPPDWSRRARGMDARLDAAREAVRAGRESTTLNPRARRLRGATAEQRTAFLRLEQMRVVVRDLAGTLEEAADADNPELNLEPGFRPRLARALRSLAEALTSYGTPGGSTDAAAAERPLQETVGQVDELQRRLAEERAGSGVAALQAEGTVLTQLARAVRILRQAPLE
jgi:hypothetical protein